MVGSATQSEKSDSRAFPPQGPMVFPLSQEHSLLGELSLYLVINFCMAAHYPVIRHWCTTGGRGIMLRVIKLKFSWWISTVPQSLSLSVIVMLRNRWGQKILKSPFYWSKTGLGMCSQGDYGRNNSCLGTGAGSSRGKKCSHGKFESFRCEDGGSEVLGCLFEPPILPLGEHHTVRLWETLPHYTGRKVELCHQTAWKGLILGDKFGSSYFNPVVSRKMHQFLLLFLKTQGNDIFIWVFYSWGSTAGYPALWGSPSLPLLSYSAFHLLRITALLQAVPLDRPDLSWFLFFALLKLPFRS